VEQIYEYYREAGFTDWTHAETGASTLKAQHPEFEMWSQGIHARSGVTCSDCHLPYMRVGAQKISDHHVRSPLLNINRACQTCHKWSDEELRTRVDFVESENSNGFHAPQEAARILGEAIDYIRQGQLALRPSSQ